MVERLRNSITIWNHEFLYVILFMGHSHGIMECFVRSRISEGRRENSYELMDQRFLGTEEFVEDIRRDLNKRASFVYDISIEEIVSEV